ncbi:MAG: DUF1345 domain-containing protein [Hyphomonadaceae bacterium]
MNDQAQTRKGPGVIGSHPALVGAALLALVAAAALWLVPNPLTPAARLLAAWDVLAVSFIALLCILKHGVTPAMMEARARAQDEGGHVVLWVCLAAAAFSLVAIGQELGAAQAASRGPKAAHALFTLATVALSWSFTHLIFASHYAHEYYLPDDEGGARRGLVFPGTESPDFSDFIHFALVIGVANQTADVQISSRRIRRTVTVHGLAAFLFNTVVLALAINYAANLFS